VARIRLDDQTSTRTSVLGTVLNHIDFTSPADLVTFARAYLSLSLSDFARAVGVERPTIYAWLNGSAVPSEASWRRLMGMGRLSMLWYIRTGRRLGASASIPLPNGGTVRDLIVDPETPTAVLESALLSLAARQASAGGQRARMAPLRVRHEVPDSQTEVDRLLGKAWAEDD
jgi:DNA-binding transcriptional regulator YiaG